VPSSSPRIEGGLRPITLEVLRHRQIAEWRSLHDEDDGMMYALAPDDKDLWRELRSKHAYLISDGVETVIAALSLTRPVYGIASFGLVLTCSPP
jgi:hypothetical protein